MSVSQFSVLSIEPTDNECFKVEVNDTFTYKSILINSKMSFESLNKSIVFILGCEDLIDVEYDAQDLVNYE